MPWQLPEEDVEKAWDLIIRKNLRWERRLAGGIRLALDEVCAAFSVVLPVPPLLCSKRLPSVFVKDVYLTIDSLLYTNGSHVNCLAAFAAVLYLSGARRYGSTSPGDSAGKRQGCGMLACC